MASRKVLGNDPFERGAATRPPAAGPSLPPSQAPHRRPPTPELQSPLLSGQEAVPPSTRPTAGDAHAHVPHPASPAAPLPRLEAPVVTEERPATPLAGAAEPSESCTPDPTAAAPQAPPSPEPRPRAQADQPPSLDPRGAEVSTLSRRPHGADRRGASVSAAVRGLFAAASAALRRAERPPELDLWGQDKELTRSLRPLAELLYERYWRVRTSGLEHVPSGPSLLVANHAGVLPLDGPVLHLALQRERPELPEARWLLDDQTLSAPVLGKLAVRLGAVRSTPEHAHRLLAEGRPVIVFPEGAQGAMKPFVERYQLQRFGRGGYLKVALREHVPVVPVAIVGSAESSPALPQLPLGLWGLEHLPIPLPPLPARWHLRFGPAVDLADASVDHEADPLWIEEKNLLVRDTIADMLAQLLAERASVF